MKAMIMPMSLVGQSDALTEFQRSIRDHFREGGSVGAFLLTAAGMLAFLLLVYGLARWQQRAASPAPARNDPHRLYVNLLRKLNLGRDQTDWLMLAARRAQLPHPALMLICERTFDECAAASAAGRADDSPPLVPSFDISVLRRRLFGG